ncbi:hypothetical protein P280DRAFT_466393 [Massarina eburnea CBS 473.64]|uniref:Uncharacterized protein n=1 Tax=Massarina eburnea CBS 473.64 TaxID=1395130 RepID=A0A6A6SEM8_9PLEO|nr:hypothetical protein P280DRAFT_466393 [Massarina eburnea CBS 473.64]
MQAINSIYNRHAAYLAASAPDTVPDSGDLTPHHQLVRSAPVISQQGTIDVQQLTALMEAHIASPSPPAVFRGQILSHPPSTDIVPPQTRQHVSLPMTRVMSMAAMSDSLNKLRGPPGGLNSTNGNTLYRNLSASDLSHRLHDIAERAAIRRRSQVSIMVTAEHINAPLRARGLSRIASVPAIAHSGTRMNDLTVYARDTDTTGPQIPLFTGSCDTNMTIPSLYGDGVLSNEHTMLNFPPGMPTGEPSFSSRPAISSTKPPVDPASFEDEDDIFMMKDTGAPAPTRTLPPSLPSAFGPIGTNRPRRASLALASRALNSATNGLPLPAAREELPALLPAILEASPSPAPAVPSVLKCPLHGDGCDGVTTTGLHRTERAIRGRGFKEVYPEIVEGGRVFVDWKKLLEEEKERVERG